MKRRSAVARPGLSQPVFCVLLLGLLTSIGSAAPALIVAGEYDADLATLRRFYQAPKAHESNHYFDMFGRGKLYQTLLSQGLTNNRALIVLSHGKGISRNSKLRYAYYPDDRIWREDTVPYFSAADLAHILGREAAAQVHNILIAGCNKEDAFDPRELRRHFVNATNITHTPGGKNGFELVFRHMLIHPSSDIRLLYSTGGDSGVARLNTGSRARKLGFTPYVADLYRPGESLPFATQIAGRELIEPSVLQTVFDLPELRLTETAFQIVNAGQQKDATVPAGPVRTAAATSVSAPVPAASQPSSGVIRWRHEKEQESHRDAGPVSSGVVRWQGTGLIEPQ